MAITAKTLAKARGFLFKNGEKPAKGVPVNRWVEEFVTVAMDHRLTFSQLLVQIRTERERHGKPTAGSPGTIRRPEDEKEMGLREYRGA